MIVAQKKSKKLWGFPSLYIILNIVGQYFTIKQANQRGYLLPYTLGFDIFWSFDIITIILYIILLIFDPGYVRNDQVITHKVTQTNQQPISARQYSSNKINDLTVNQQNYENDACQNIDSAKSNEKVVLLFGRNSVIENQIEDCNMNNNNNKNNNANNNIKIETGQVVVQNNQDRINTIVDQNYCQVSEVDVDANQNQPGNQIIDYNINKLFSIDEKKNQQEIEIDEDNQVPSSSKNDIPQVNQTNSTQTQSMLFKICIIKKLKLKLKCQKYNDKSIQLIGKIMKSQEIKSNIHHTTNFTEEDNNIEEKVQHQLPVQQIKCSPPNNTLLVKDSVCVQSQAHQPIIYQDFTSQKKQPSLSQLDLQESKMHLPYARQQELEEKIQEESEKQSKPLTQQQKLVQLKEQSEQDKALDKEQPKRQFKQAYIQRYCLICLQDQPLRTKHCKFCQVCVATYDHHCPWVGNCIGEKNKLIFYFFLLSQTVIQSYLYALNIQFLIGKYLKKPEQSSYTGFLASLYWVILLLAIIQTYFICLLGYLIMLHSYLVLNNLTTWENECWQKITYLKELSKENGSPFSQGYLNNLKIFFNFRLFTHSLIEWKLEI